MIRALTPLTPNTVELIPTLGALSPRGGPVQDPVITGGGVDRVDVEVFVTVLVLHVEQVPGFGFRV